MKRSLRAAGAAVLLTLLPVPALGTDWVELGPKLNAAVSPHRVSQPAPVVIGNFVTAGPATPNKGGSPTLGGPPLEYVYDEQYCYCVSGLPWNGSTSEVRLQTLYTKSEIGRPGTIHEMAVFQDYYGQYYHGTFPNVSVKLCNTPVTSLGSSMSGNYGGATPVTVWHASSHTTGIDGYRAWDTIDFATDFSYDSSKNLLIEVTWQGSASGQTYSWWGPHHSSPHMAYYYGSDTTCDSA